MIRAMDISTAAIGLRNAEVASQVQVAVAKKVLDMQKFNGATVLKLLEGATAGVAQAGDALVAAATGLGGAVDTYG